jgi:hypothetical protein
VKIVVRFFRKPAPEAAQMPAPDIEPYFSKIERNEIYRYLEQSAMNVEEYEAEFTSTGFLIRARGTEAFFTARAIHPDLTPTYAEYRVHWSDGERKPVTGIDTQYGSLGNYINGWTSDVVFVKNEPDLWSELSGRRESIFGNQGKDFENSHFTDQEILAISSGIDRIRTVAEETLELTPDQFTVLNERLDQVVEAAQRLGRIDWRAMSVGLLFSYALEIAMSPSAAQSLILEFGKVTSAIAYPVISKLGG